jgi:hypothetical protein
VSRSAVYNEMRDNPDFREDVERVKDECVELVEQVLFKSALTPDPANSKDRQFYLRAMRPDKYAGIGQHQLEQVKQQARRKALQEIQDQIALLTPEARKALQEAMRAAAARELPTPTPEGG